MTTENKIKKFEKAGAKVEKLEGFGYGANEYKATFENGKVCFFDEMAFWFELGYDNCNQETFRSFYYTAKSAINRALAA